MSEFTAHEKERIEPLLLLYNEIMAGADLVYLTDKNRELIDTVVPTDIVLLVDALVTKMIPMDELKMGINKLLGLLHNAIANHPYKPPVKESYIGCLVENNRILDEKLQEIAPLLQKFEKSPENVIVKNSLIDSFKELERYNSYYHIKENILFPEIEKFIEKHHCISVMGSFHNDVREKMKQTIDTLSHDTVNYDRFKKLSAELFFLMYSLKFREERILYAFIQNSISDEILDSLFEESLEIGFPFFHPKKEDENGNLFSLN